MLFEMLITKFGFGAECHGFKSGIGKLSKLT